MLIRTTRTLSTWALRALFYAVLFGVVVISHLGISGALRAQGWDSGTSLLVAGAAVLILVILLTNAAEWLRDRLRERREMQRVQQRYRITPAGHGDELLLTRRMAKRECLHGGLDLHAGGIAPGREITRWELPPRISLSFHRAGGNSLWLRNLFHPEGKFFDTFADSPAEYRPATTHDSHSHPATTCRRRFAAPRR